MTPPPGWYADPSANRHARRALVGRVRLDRAPAHARRPPHGPGAAGVRPADAAAAGALRGRRRPGQGRRARRRRGGPGRVDRHRCRGARRRRRRADGWRSRADHVGAVDTPSPTSPTPTTSAPDPDPSHLVDQLNGITIPVLDGWEKADNTVGSDPTIWTPDTYDCPGEGSFCRHGTVYSRTATATDERSPKALALGDIKDAADRAYDQDAIGRELFGGITRHEKVKEGSGRSQAARDTSSAGASTPRRAPADTSSRSPFPQASGPRRRSSSASPSTPATARRPSPTWTR